MCPQPQHDSKGTRLVALVSSAVTAESVLMRASAVMPSMTAVIGQTNVTAVSITSFISYLHQLCNNVIKMFIYIFVPFVY